MAVSSAGISDLEYKARELRKLIIQMVTEGGLGRWPCTFVRRHNYLSVR